jgi:hypothetical protein
MSEQGYIVARLRARAVERRLRDINMIGEANVAPIGSFFDWQAAEEIASLRAQLAIAGEHIAEMTDQLATSQELFTKYEAAVGEFASAMVLLEDVPGETVLDRVMRIVEWHHALAEDNRATKDQLASAMEEAEHWKDLVSGADLAINPFPLSSAQGKSDG